jgi:four helix bundle protein
MTRKRPLSRDYKLCDQIHAAAMSIPANIAEGFERGTRAEFHRFLSISKGSCAELRTYIHLARRLGYLDDISAKKSLSQAEEVSRIIGGLRTKVGQQRRTPKA